MRRYRKLPPAKRLRELPCYDPETGLLTWRVRVRGRSKSATSAVAGTRKAQGHIQVGVDGIRYLAHRLIWKMQTGRDPRNDIDHRDLDGCNNRWANLLEVTQTQNNLNRRCQRHSVTGLKGVSHSRCRGKRTGKFIAQVVTPGGKKYLGTFDSAEAAHSAWWAAELEAWGEFARKE